MLQTLRRIDATASRWITVRRAFWLSVGVVVANTTLQWSMYFVVHPTKTGVIGAVACFDLIMIVWVTAVTVFILRLPVPRVIAALAAANWVDSFVMTFAALYFQAAGRTPNFGGPLSRIDAVYLSITTMTTTGFGDIVPRSQAARLLVTSEMFLTFTAVAVVVGLTINAIARRD